MSDKIAISIYFDRKITDTYIYRNWYGKYLLREAAETVNAIKQCKTAEDYRKSGFSSRDLEHISEPELKEIEGWAEGAIILDMTAGYMYRGISSGVNISSIYNNEDEEYAYRPFILPSDEELDAMPVVEFPEYLIDGGQSVHPFYDLKGGKLPLTDDQLQKIISITEPTEEEIQAEKKRREKSTAAAEEYEAYKKWYDEIYLDGGTPAEKYHIGDSTESLEALHLSISAYHALKRAGIDTIGQLSIIGMIEAPKIRNLGRRRFEEVTFQLYEYLKEHQKI